MLNLLDKLCKNKHISQADYFFAKLIADQQKSLNYEPEQQNLAILLASLCQYSLSQGNTCLFLEPELTQNYFGLAYKKFDENESEGRELIAEINEKIGNLSYEKWAESLKEHIAFTAEPEEKVAPLVFQFFEKKFALYFYRTWQDEECLSQYIKTAVENGSFFEPFIADENKVKQILEKYFAPATEQRNWQKIAVALALRQQFCLISGGPGTGKTYSVARLIAVLQELYQELGVEKLNIGLAAPTGKAATRLNESIEKEFASLTELTGKNLYQKAKTIHSLLGVRPFTEDVQYNQKRPLPYDVLIVDEASMIDLSMMAKLCKALSTKTKLILLGDKDQLSSVEAGATLGELGQFIYWHFDEKQQKNIGCYSPEFTQYLTAVTGENLPPSQKVEPLTNCLCFLPDSRRFTENSGIGQLAKKVNQVNQKVSSWELFNQHFDVGQISVIELKVELKKEQQEPENEKNELTYLNQIAETAVEKYQDYLAIVQRYQSTQNKEELTHLFKAFNSARFLTALRQGEFGVEGLNQRIAEKLKEKGLVTFKQERDWYIGKPIMITQNDPNTKLSNGDIGIYVGNNQICFEEDGLRFVSKSRIPTGFETAYTMTVHKSQGSEFSHTFLILPKENNPLLTKELIYTAITRARDTFTLFSAKSLWESAVKRESKRQSGLKNRLKLAFDQRNVKKL